MYKKSISIITLLLLCLLVGCSAESGCPKISNPRVTVGSSGVTVETRESGYFRIEFGPTGFTRGTGWNLWEAGNILYVGPMAPSTTYDIYITKVCDPESESDPYVLSALKTNASNCTYPVSVDITQSSPTALSLDFDYGDFNDPDHFELEYGLEGFTQGTGTSVSIPGNSSSAIGLSDLQAGERYDLYFRAVCSGLDGTPWKKVPYTLGVNCQEPIDLNSIIVSGSCSTGVGATRMFSWSYPYSSVYNYSISLVSANNIGNPDAGQIFTTTEESISIPGLDCTPRAFFVRANRYGNQTGSAWAGPFYF